MDETERSELELLKQRQESLGRQLAHLAKEIEALEARLGNKSGEFALAAQPSATPTAPVPRVAAAVPPPIPPLITTVPTAASHSGHGPASSVGTPLAAQASLQAAPPAPKVPLPSHLTASPASSSPPPLTTAPAPQASPPRSFELRLGTFWLPLIGIVLLVTGLVFFGNYAYQNFIVLLNAGGKVFLLYTASFTLLGLGWWWQRKKVKESLQNYGQVLFAGGLAMVYFTTYAAHHFNHLRIITSPVLDGALLLGWAAYMVWIADRRKSQVLALFAVLLAYYTAVITRVGQFTLYSNLVLTLAALFFMVRNRWAVLSFTSLAASYAAYGYWRFFNGQEWHWASVDEGLWTGTYFLIAYWIVFTAAVFLSKDEKFAGPNRSSFLTLNNGAFFTMFLLTMRQVHHHGFWKFSLIYGVVLIALAELSRRTLRAEPVAANSYLTQGLLLGTIGLISNPNLAGLNLALVLAAETVTLLLAGHQRRNIVLLIGAYGCAALSVGWGMDGMLEHEPHGLWLGIGLGAIMLGNTLLVDREYKSLPKDRLRPQVSYFAVLALAIWWVATYDNAHRAELPLLLAAEGLLFTWSYYLLRIPEISFFSQGYVFLAQITWLVPVLEGAKPPAWWNPLLLILLTLVLSHWWQKQQVLLFQAEVAQLCQGIYAAAIVALIYFWISPQIAPARWIALSSALAIAVTAYGVFTRSWLLAIFGQFFLLIGVVQFSIELCGAKPNWPLALAPIAALGLLSWSAWKWFQVQPDSTGRVSKPLLQTARIYRWIALLMSLWWILKYIPDHEQVWFFVLVSFLIFAWAGWRRSAEGLIFAGIYLIAAIALFWIPEREGGRVYGPNLLAWLVLLAEQRIAKRLPHRYQLDPRIHGAMIVIGGLGIWLFLSDWVIELTRETGNQRSYLTASYSVLGLIFFTIGIALRERVYRWLGLGILAFCLVRVMVIDVWKLELLYKVLSFMALGIVLLVLGFVYNKYQEKIREWL